MAPSKVNDLIRLPHFNLRFPLPQAIGCASGTYLFRLPSVDVLAMLLSNLDNKTIILVVRSDTEQRVLKGTARYERRVDLGWVLTIALEDPDTKHGRPSLILPESTWCGEVHQCDYCIYFDEEDIPAQQANATEPR